MCDTFCIDFPAFNETREMGCGEKRSMNDLGPGDAVPLAAATPWPLAAAAAAPPFRRWPLAASLYTAVKSKVIQIQSNGAHPAILLQLLLCYQMATDFHLPYGNVDFITYTMDTNRETHYSESYIMKRLS